MSGHKYGLAYPGIGFNIWRSRQDLPEDLIFHVNYLGGHMPTFTLNFSRPGNQIIGQYYNFVRLGHDGCRRIMERLRDVAVHISDGIADIGPFEVLTSVTDLPVVAVRLTGDLPFTVFHVAERLRTGGWQVPAYTMPADATDLAVMRIVVREGFGTDLANGLPVAMRESVDYLTANPPGRVEPVPGFSHT